MHVYFIFVNTANDYIIAEFCVQWFFMYDDCFLAKSVSMINASRKYLLV